MKNALRIAFIDSSGEMGGAEHLLLKLIEGLPANQVNALLICGQDGSFPTEAKQHGIQTEIIPSPRFVSLSVVINGRKVLNPLAVVRNALNVIRASRRLSRQLKASRINLVQTNTNFAHIYGGLAARLAGVPCIWYYHDLIETHRLRGSIAAVWRLLSRLLASHVVGVSQAVVDALAIGARASVIYTGLERPTGRTVADLRASLGLPAEAKLIGFIGRIGYVKALDILAYAAQEVIAAQPTVHFVLFGEAMFGEQSVKTALVLLVNQLGLNKQWHWLGYDPQATARLPELDLLVLPSRREALPLVLLEAGLMATPTVASRVGGIPEIIIDEQTGLLVTPGSVTELSAAILRLVLDPALATDIGKKSQQRIEALFNPARYYAEFLALFARYIPGGIS